MTKELGVCVFCGAQDKVPQKYLDVGTKFGEWLAAKGRRLVYGGGDSGMMGRVANGVMDSGGYVTGVYPRDLEKIAEVEHKGLSEIHIVDTMHERKELMYSESDTFVIFPGGCGTMDEFFEILTWAQLQLHEKPIIIFNYDGYWDHLVALLHNIVDKGFAKPATREYYSVVDEYEDLIRMIRT